MQVRTGALQHVSLTGPDKPEECVRANSRCELEYTFKCVHLQACNRRFAPGDGFVENVAECAHMHMYHKALVRVRLPLRLMRGVSL
eukprot:6212659-Pleurochrysis_carterae.AAC.1